MTGGGLVQSTETTAGGYTATGSGSGDGAVDPLAGTSRPRIVIQTEGHTVVLTQQDMLLLAVVLVVFSDLAVTAAEAIR